MRVTCSVTGNNQTQASSFELIFRGTRILVDCPLDLTSSLQFLPVSLPARQFSREQPEPVNALSTKPRSLPQDSPPEDNGNGEFSGHDQGDSQEELPRSPYIELGGHLFIDDVPAYRAPALGLIDAALLDAVLITSSDGLLGLPFLENFAGRVYAGEATLRVGKLAALELISLHEEFLQLYGYPLPGDESERSEWLNPSALSRLPAEVQACVVGPHGELKRQWRNLYSIASLEACLKRVTGVHMGENVPLGTGVVVTPVSSGASLGSCNWVIKHAASGGQVLFLGPSLRTPTHAAAFDASAVGSSSTLVLGAVQTSAGRGGVYTGAKLQQGPERELPPRGLLHEGALCGIANQAGMLADVAAAVVATVAQGGSALLPLAPGGTMLELIEQLGARLQAAGLGSVPILYISPVALELLPYGNIVPEWLAPTRQERLYRAEPLFGHLALEQEMRLKAFSSLAEPSLWAELRRPCVVLAAHQWLRAGPAVKLLLRWRDDPASCLIITQLHADVELMVAPFQPMAMRVLHIPVDAWLREDDVVQLVKEGCPRTVVVSQAAYERLQGKLPGTEVLPYIPGTSLVVPTPSSLCTVEMSKDLVHRVGPALAAGAQLLPGKLAWHDGKLQLGHAG